MHEPDQRSAFDSGAPQTTAPTACCCCSITRSSRSSGKGNGIRCATAICVLFADYTDRACSMHVGMRIVTAWEFDLYGGTVLLAAVHGEAEPDESVLAHPRNRGCAGHHRPGRRRTTPTQRRSACRIAAELARRGGGGRAHRPRVRRCVAGGRALQPSPGSIRGYLRRSPTRRPPSRAGGCPGPISRSCRRINSSRPNPDRVLLTLPDLLHEVSARFPELDGRWKVDGPGPAH